MERMTLEGKTILIISPEKWGPYFVSKHHYALTLSKKNKVFFLNPPLPFQLKGIRNFQISTNLISNNLTEISYSNNLPKLGSLPNTTRKNIYSKFASKLLRNLNMKNFDIVWSFDPSRFWDPSVFYPESTIYHAVDDHKSDTEEELASMADLVIVVSEYLKTKLKSSNPNIFVSGHGVSSIVPENTDIPVYGNRDVKIDIVGNFLSKNLDLEFLYLLCNELLDIADFSLIGPIKSNNLGGKENEEILCNLARLDKLSNVNLIGPVPSNKLHSYLSQADIHLVLYKDHTNNINPHKIMQYLLTGKVVMSSYLHDLDLYPTGSILTIDKNNWIEQFKLTVQNLDAINSDGNMNKRIEFAKTNSYDNKINLISELLNK